ncbi:hypothetical protein CSW98_04915 [Vibrio sp. HA2012]|nr:hypothetical protein CSW98_04915 [Vibrio sp. HA2012]
MTYIRALTISTICMLLPIKASLAHTPFMACFDNTDGTITCNGEFSDGTSGAWVDMQVIDDNGGIIYKGKMDENGEYTFTIPDKTFTVIFDAGPGHVVKEKSSNIIE